MTAAKPEDGRSLPLREEMSRESSASNLGFMGRQYAPDQASWSRPEEEQGHSAYLYGRLSGKCEESVMYLLTVTPASWLYGFYK
jgi:hypothetical protein